MKCLTIRALRISQSAILVLPARFQHKHKLLTIGVSALLLLSGSIIAAPTTWAQEIEPQATEGTLDPSFGSGGKVVTDFFGFADNGRIVVVQPDAKIIVGGSVRTAGPDSSDFGLVRYNPDGSLDLGFGTAGRVTTDFFRLNDHPLAIALQPDGKIVAAGQAPLDSGVIVFAVARYDTDGRLDAAFGTDGRVTVSFSGLRPTFANAMAIQPDGKIVLAGSTDFTSGSSTIALARLNTNGTLDPSFGVGGKTTGPVVSTINFVNGVAVQSNGKIYVSGYTGLAPASIDFMLVRCEANGSVDTSFGTNGVVTTDFFGLSDPARCMLALPGGKVIVAGTATAPGNDLQFAMARYNSDGTLDATFGTGGKVTTGFPGAQAINATAALQPDGRIVLAGWVRIVFSDLSDFALARYTSNGSLDSSFGTSGLVTTDFFGFAEEGRGIALARDGSIVLAGEVRTTADPGKLDFAVARYLGTPPNFSLNMSQATVAAQRGAKVKVEILISRSAGFTGAVTVSAPDSTSAFKPKPSEPKTTTGDRIVFKLKIKSGAATGPRQVTFVGRNEDGQIATAIVTLDIH